MNMHCTLFKKLKAVVTQLNHQFRLVTETSTIGRPKKISSIDAMTLSLYQHQSTRATKKSVYEDFKETLNCSYKTLVVSMNRSALLCLRLISIIMRFNRKFQHLVKYTDSTDIPVCLKKNADEHRTMAGLASLGRSSKGWFYGLRMTLTRDFEGRMLGVKFSTATANDRDTFREVNKDIFGIIVSDAGYVSKKLEDDMNINGKRWILIRPYKTMKKLMTKWQENLYRGIFQIEFDFRSLKMFYGLVTNLPRSINGYLANYIHALTSFVLR